MKTLLNILMAILGIILVFSSLNIAASALEDNEPAAETDRVIVTVNEEDAGVLGDSDPIHTVQIGGEQLTALEVPEDETLESFIEDLTGVPGVIAVEPDYLVHMAGDYHQYHLQKIQADLVWKKTQGSKDITVAVIDNGVDLNHIELKHQIVKPYDAVKKSTSSIPAGDHGTHVAGIVAASLDNAYMGAGVAPNTSIMPINVFIGKSAYISDIIGGIYYAVDNGVDIINLSLGTDTYSTAFDEAIQYAFSKNVTIIAAAGNQSTNLQYYPAAFDNVISVGSTTASDELSFFSNYGKTLDITAPGSNIMSTLPANSFGEMSGTSMAAPVVAGVAALILANEPGLSNEDVAARLFSTADDLGEAGYDQYFGHGRVNAKKALNLTTFPAPKSDKVYDISREITGTIPAEIKNARVIVSNRAGSVLGSAEVKKGSTNFLIAIPQQKAGTLLHIRASDSLGNSSDPLEVIVEKLNFNETVTSLLGHLKNKNIRIYQNFYNEMDYKSAGTGLTNHVYFIKKQVYYNGNLFYLISQNPSSVIGIVGWVKAEDLSTKTHKGLDKKAKTLYVTGNGSAYKKAWGGSKDFSYSSLASYKNQAFRINLTETVGNAVWHRGELDGKSVWIQSTNLTALKETKTSQLGHFRNGNNKIYQELGNEKTVLTAGAKYTNAVYYIKKEAVINDQKFYLLSQKPSSTSGVVGWVNAEDLTVQKHVGVDKKVSTYRLKGTGSAYAHAWGGSKDKVFKDLSKYKNAKFKVNLTEKVGNSTWYRGELKGKVVWVHSSQVSK